MTSTTQDGTPHDVPEHLLDGARAAFRSLFPDASPESPVDPERLREVLRREIARERLPTP